MPSRVLLYTLKHYFKTFHYLNFLSVFIPKAILAICVQKLFFQIEIFFYRALTCGTWYLLFTFYCRQYQVSQCNQIGPSSFRQYPSLQPSSPMVVLLIWTWALGQGQHFHLNCHFQIDEELKLLVIHNPGRVIT